MERIKKGNDVSTETNKEKSAAYNKKAKLRKICIITLPIIVIMIAVIFVTTNVKAAAYYTVDINPSICIDVDKNEIVTNVKCLNDDATNLLKDMNLIGKPAAEAVQMIIDAAKSAGYIPEGKYVLIGRFSDDEKETALSDLQNNLESKMGDMINLLVVSGTIKDKKSADELSVSAGLLKLSKLTEGIEVKSGDKVEDIITKVNVNQQPPTNETSNFAVSGSISEKTININWAQATGTGFSGYKIVVSKTNPAPKYPEDGYIRYITDISTTSVTLNADTEGFEADTNYYFSVTYLYNNAKMIAGNALQIKMPAKSTDPAPSPGTTPVTSPVSTTINGSISGNKVNLNWDKITHNRLDGYKVMYSFSDATPVYGESGCNYALWITDADTTSCSINVTSLSGYTSGATCYFSISALYDSHNVIKAGNTIALTMPAAVVEPYISTSVSGSISGNTISLNWDKITHSQLEGYKVMYSFTDPTPVYGESGCNYAYWITNADTTSCTINATTLSGYTSGATCYFSITALYNGHSASKTGNVLTFTLPATK